MPWRTAKRVRPAMEWRSSSAMITSAVAFDGAGAEGEVRAISVPEFLSAMRRGFSVFGGG